MALSLEEASSMADTLLGQAADELSKPLAMPSYTKVDTKPVKAAAVKVRESGANVQQVLDQENQRNAQANSAAKGGIDARAQAAADASDADQARAQTIADNNNYVNNLFGISADPSAAIAATARSKTLESDKAMTMLRGIQQKQSVSLVDDPLEYLGNVLTLPSEISTYNRQVDIVNSLDSNIETGMRNANSMQNAVNSGVPTITASQNKATKDKAFAQAAIDKAAADNKLAIENTDFASKQLAKDMSVYSATSQSTAMDIQQAEAQFTQQIQAIRITESRAARLEAASKNIEIWGQNKALEKALENADRQLGFSPGTTTRFQFQALPKERQAKIISVAAGKFGSDPLDALDTLRELGVGPGMGEDTRAMFDWMNKQRLAILGNTNDQELLAAKGNKEEFRAVLTKKLNGRIEQALAGAGQDITSPYHELTPAKMIASGALPEGSVLIPILEPFVNSKEPMRPEIIAETFMTHYPDINQAGPALAAYYRANIDQRNTYLPATAASIPLSKKYIVQLPGFMSSTPFDLTDVASATKYLIMKRAKDLSTLATSPTMNISGAARRMPESTQ